MFDVSFFLQIGVTSEFFSKTFVDVRVESPLVQSLLVPHDVLQVKGNLALKSAHPAALWWEVVD